jgi:hypothetical protein
LHGRKISKPKEELLERFFVTLIASGVTLELVALPISLWESAKVAETAAKANERAANVESNNLVLRSNLAALELRLIEATNEITKIDPVNLPISSVKANVMLVAQGTNFWANVDPTTGHGATLAIGNRDWVLEHNATQLLMVCTRAERFGGAGDSEWILEFEPDPTPVPNGAAWNLTLGDSVRSAERWDFMLLYGLFLRNHSQITGGDLTLIVNTTVKHVRIPAQTAEEQFGRFGDLRLIGSAALNGVNVIVIPGP